MGGVHGLDNMQRLTSCMSPQGICVCLENGVAVCPTKRCSLNDVRFAAAARMCTVHTACHEFRFGVSKQHAVRSVLLFSIVRLFFVSGPPCQQGSATLLSPSP
jgi:hypothetical protein